MSDLSLSITVATYNRSGSLGNCLQALANQTNKEFKILIIDGGSDDDTWDIVHKYKQQLNLRLIQDSSPHLAYIRDLGWREADTELVAWIDDDVVVDTRWVEAVKRAFADNPGLGGVTGPTTIPEYLLKKRDVFYFYTTKNSSSAKNFIAKIYFNLFMEGDRYGIGKIYPSGAWSPGANFPRARELKEPFEVDYLEACNFVFRRKIFEKVGGFDPRYIKTSEWCEVDLAFRVRKEGYKLLFDPKMAVEHCVSQSGVYPRRLRPISRLKNFLRFYTKTYYPAQGYRYFSSLFLFPLYTLFLIMYCVYIRFRNP